MELGFLHRRSATYGAAMLLALSISTLSLAANPRTEPLRSPEYVRGHKAILAKDWNKAYEIFLALWQKTNGTDDTAAVAFNLGQAELVLGKNRDAAEHLSAGLMTSDNPEAKASARKMLNRAKKRIGTLKISTSEGAEVFVDGKSVGIAPLPNEVFVEPGLVKITVEHPKGHGETDLEVRADDARTVEISLKANPEASKASKLPYRDEALRVKEPKPSEPANPPPEPEKHRGLETRTIVLIVGGAVTVIAGATAGYFGLKARSAGNEAERLLGQAEAQLGQHRCSTPAAAGAGVCAEIQTKLSDHDSAGRIYNVMLPIAGVAAVSTGLLYVLLPSEHRAASRSLALMPLADQRTGGLLFQGEF